MWLTLEGHARACAGGVTGMPEIFGTCDERFAPVRRALADNFRDHGELGAAVAIAVDGQPVVDIWAGWKDSARTRPWERDTLVPVFSVGKAMAVLCVLLLVERGEIDLDAPVPRYWPEFAAAGKGGVTVRTLLSHRAGLPAVRDLLPDEAIYDWDRMAGTLAAEEPWWEPGSTHGYHVNTLGFLAGETVRRVAGMSIGAFFRAEIAEPLGADFHFGFGADEDHRVAEYTFGGGSTERRPVPPGEERQFLLNRVYLNPPGLSGLGTVNTRAWRAAEIPSANGHATARAVMRIYGALGREMLTPQTLEQAIAEHSAGPDFVLGRPSRFGLGFQLTQPERPLGPNPRSFGHFGVGGSLGFADLDAGLAFAYTMNRFGPRWQNPRNRALIDAVYASL
jgi:CubicO group peptidase (beta-lactamase class C family)